MSTTKEYADYIIEQLLKVGNVRSRKMMGEYVVYYNDKVIGGIYDNRFLVKITDSSTSILSNAKKELPYEGAKLMYLVEEAEDEELMKKLLDGLYDDLPYPKPKKKKAD